MKNPDNLGAFLESNFWEGICNNFLKPYNEKLWKMDLNKISSNWTDRIPFWSAIKVLKGAFIKDDKNYWSNSYVNYPVSWWFENYLAYFFSKIKEYIDFSCQIINIDTRYHIIYTKNQVIHYDNLISTIPLNELLEFSGMDYDAGLFKYLSIQIFTVVIKKIKELKQRIYVKDKKYYFHKCVFNSNSSLLQKNQDEFVVQFEATFKKNEVIKKDEFEANCFNYLIEKGLIKNLNDVIARDYKEVEYGYPTQILDLLEKKDFYINQLKEMQIFVLWRFWAWEYCNLWDVINNANILFKYLENENFII